MKKKIIRKLTKKIKIISYKYFLNHYQSNDTILKLHHILNSQDNQQPYLFNLILSQHATVRWNQRVGPKTSKFDLQLTLQLLLELGRIEITGDYGIIDNDIIFTYTTDNNNTLTITSFYGRRSITPALNNFDAFRTYTHKQQELINLNISDDKLTKQILPAIPCERMIFKGNRTKYIIDRYKNDFSRVFLTFVNGRRQDEGFSINLYNPKQEKLNNSVLRALSYMGYENFVFEHLYHHKTKSVESLIAKFSSSSKNYS